MKSKDLDQIKELITRMVGNKVKLEEAKGRQRYEITEGTVKNAYPCVFTVEVTESIIGTKDDFLVNTMADRVVSFNYTDLLTEDVSITLI